MKTEIFTKSPLKRKNERLKDRLEKDRERRRSAVAKCAEKDREIRQLRRRVDMLADGMVHETCPYCFSDVEMTWDTERLGYRAFCPVCGARMMLCTECAKKNGAAACDYNYGTDNCKYSKGGARA